MSFRFWFCLYCIWFALCQQKAPWIRFLVFDLGFPPSNVEWINIWFGFDSISTGQFPAMVCSISEMVNGEFSFLVQFIHTFNRVLKVMILETRICVTCHFILVLLSSTLMKQLTCNVWYYLSYAYFGLDIKWVWYVFWFGYLVGKTCSRLQDLTLVVFFT